MATESSAGVWQARLGSALDPRAARLNDSLPVDATLWPEELMLSRAYARALAEAGVLDDSGLTKLLGACEALEAELAAGATRLTGEDVHSAVESELTRLCGDPAARLHTGRSRNDQVATLVRMRVMTLCERAVEHVRGLERALVAQACAAGETAVAAQTHLQPAQPVLLAHLWLAHVAAFERDEARLLAAREEADRLPLGASAVAGTPLQYDRAALAVRLGFSRLATNSVDAVGDRDFALVYLQAAAVLGVHLSRLAEDLVLWCSHGYGWYSAPDGFSTGSSLLPQKRNPDLFELARGKSARLIANAERIAVLLKGLPSSYQKDLQEDKEAIFDTADTLDLLLPALAPPIEALAPDPGRMAAGLTVDLLAVELADALVEWGVAFRDAHGAVGRLWAAAERRRVDPVDVPESERLAFSPHFTDDVLASLDVERSLARRNHSPGTGRDAVAGELARAEGRLGLGPGLPQADGERVAAAVPAAPATPSASSERVMRNGVTLRAARPGDVPGIAGLMADFVVRGDLLPRPVGELYQCVREFRVAVAGDRVVACAALRLLWGDLGEVRSLAVLPERKGTGLGAALVGELVAQARTIGLPRVIALTREVGFFERCGFHVVERETLPRKVWSDCVRCPRRHACDETAVVIDLVAGASASAGDRTATWVLPLPRSGPDVPVEAVAE